MNLNDKKREELRSNLDNSISTLKNSQIVLSDNDLSDTLVKNAYAYSYDFLLFFKLQSDKASAEHLSAAFKDLKNYIKKIYKNGLLPKNQSKPTIDDEVSKPLSTMSSNLFKSIPMNDPGTFNIFRQLQTDNMEFFYDLDCFDNDYYRVNGLSKLYSNSFLSQVEVDKIFEEVKRTIPSKDINNHMKFISYFLSELILKHVRSYDKWRCTQILVNFQACFDFLNIRNVELGENFIHKFQNLTKFLQYKEDFARSNDYLANIGPFYSEILNKVNDADFRKEVYSGLMMFFSPRLFLNDLNYLLVKDNKIAIDIMQNLNNLDYIFHFLCYKLYINNENFIEIVSSISSFIKKRIKDKYWISNFEYFQLDDFDSPTYELQVLFVTLNMIKETSDSSTVALILESLQYMIKEYYGYQVLVPTLNSNILPTILDEDKINIQKVHTNLYILVINIISNLKIFYKDYSEKIIELDNLLIKMKPYYSNKLNFEEIYNNYYAPEKKEYHFSGEFDTKKIAEGFSEFSKIIEKLSRFIES